MPLTRTDMQSLPRSKAGDYRGNVHRALLGSAPPTTQHIDGRERGGERERDYTSLWCLQETKHQGEKREKELVFRREKEESIAEEGEEELTSEPERQIGSLMEDLWFGKGVTSAPTELDLTGTVQCGAYGDR